MKEIVDIPAYLLFLFSVLIYILGFAAGYFFRRLIKYDGAIEVLTDEDGAKTFTINLANEDPWELDKKKRVVFKIISKGTIAK